MSPLDFIKLIFAAVGSCILIIVTMRLLDEKKRKRIIRKQLRLSSPNKNKDDIQFNFDRESFPVIAKSVTVADLLHDVQMAKEFFLFLDKEKKAILSDIKKESGDDLSFSAVPIN